VHAFRTAPNRCMAVAGLALASFEAAVLALVVLDLVLLLVSHP
jgi:hypothetical protein